MADSYVLKREAAENT